MTDQLNTPAAVRSCPHGGSFKGSRFVSVMLGEAHMQTTHPFRFCFILAEDVDMIFTCESCKYCSE